MKTYFSLSEFLKTSYPIKNRVTSFQSFTPSDIHSNISRLIDVLSVLRGLIGEPITITSGYRCPKLNSIIPGSSENSFHLKGRAADITCNKLHELLELCLKLEESQVFVEVIYHPESNFIHVAI